MAAKELLYGERRPAVGSRDWLLASYPDLSLVAMGVRHYPRHEDRSNYLHLSSEAIEGLNELAAHLGLGGHFGQLVTTTSNPDTSVTDLVYCEDNNFHLFNLQFPEIIYSEGGNSDGYYKRAAIILADALLALKAELAESAT